MGNPELCAAIAELREQYAAETQRHAADLFACAKLERRAERASRRVGKRSVEQSIKRLSSKEEAGLKEAERKGDANAPELTGGPLSSGELSAASSSSSSDDDDDPPPPPPSSPSVLRKTKSPSSTSNRRMSLGDSPRSMRESSSSEDEEDDDEKFWSVSALQLAEKRIVELDTAVVRSGYLLKATRSGEWRCARAELRRCEGAFFELQVSFDVEQNRTIKKPKNNENFLLGFNDANTIQTISVTKFEDDDDYCQKEASTPRGGRHVDANARCFALRVAGESSAWMAACKADRNGWLDSLNMAIDRSLAKQDNCADSVKNFEATIERARKSMSREEFLNAVTTSARCYKLPAKWARAQAARIKSPPPSTGKRHRRRSTKKKLLDCSPALIPTAARQLAQMRKDMLRDRVRVDGKELGTTEAVVEQTARQLSRRLSEVAKAVGCPLSEAGALQHAVVILAASARTSSGGDAYSCVHALCHPCRELVVVCPASAHASPLEIEVDAAGNHRRRSSISPAYNLATTTTKRSPGTLSPISFFSSPSASQAKKFFSVVSNAPAAETTKKPGIRVRVTAAVAYRVCTTDPQDDPSDTWAFVRAIWDQEFDIYGDPSELSPNSVATDPTIRIAISDFTLLDPDELPDPSHVRRPPRDEDEQEEAGRSS